jgi:PAS domain S-box-containing protein
MQNITASTYLFSGNKERTDQLINCLPLGVIIHGKGTEILFSNKAAQIMLGLDGHELYGRTADHIEWNIIHEDGTEFPWFSHPASMANSSKEPVFHVIMGVYRPVSDDRVWLLVNAEPLFDEVGEVIEVICSFSDITERKQVEEKLNWLYQNLEVRALELATTNADLEIFLHIATHDLQEPLRLVSSFTQLLKKKYAKQLDEQANEYINYAVDGASRMKKLILDLLEFSNFSSNKDDFLLTDLNLVLLEVKNKLSHEIKANNAEIIIPVLPVIYAKKTLVSLLFENLIENSLKYRTACNPVIQIQCSLDNGNYLFSVSDNGIGIDKKYANKIFVLFKRLHNDNEKYEGTGLGLAICKKIVEMHRGTIWVASEQSKGSTFYFTISNNII